MSDNRAIFRFKKGLRRCYALGLISTRETLVVLPSRTSVPVKVTGDDRKRYRPVCNLKGGVGSERNKMLLDLESQKDRAALGIKRNGKFSRIAGGFDRYPFASPFGPALFVLAWGTDLWRIENVAPHMVALSEQIENDNGFTGLERLYVDVCRVGLYREFIGLQISVERQSWLAALAASANGHHDVALGFCKNLPEGQFPERNALVIAAVQAGFNATNGTEQLLDATDKSTVAGKVLLNIWGKKPINQIELRTGAVEIASWIADPVVRRTTINNLLPGIRNQLTNLPSLTPKNSMLAKLWAQARLQDALEGIFSAQWERASNIAKEVLSLTNQEDIRDEALNLLACAQWQLGYDERAIKALLHALEGEYNASLQTNIGVVAANLEPNIAAEYLGQLSMEAPTVELKYAALIRGVAIWSESLSEEDESPMPSYLSKAARTLASSSVISNDLSDEELWSVLETLAVHDSNWLKTHLQIIHNDIRTSTTRKQMIQVALARTENPFEYVKTVGQLNDHDSPWCAKQRHAVVSLVLRVQSDMPLSQFATAMGIELLKTDINLTPANGVKIRLFSVLGVCHVLDSEEEEPPDQVRALLFEAYTILTNQCSVQEQLDLQGLLEMVGSRTLASVVRARYLLIVKINEATDKLISDIRYIPRYRLNMSALRESTRPMIQMCQDSIQVVNQLKQFSKEEEIINYARSVVEFAEAIIERLELSIR